MPSLAKPSQAWPSQAWAGLAKPSLAGPARHGLGRLGQAWPDLAKPGPGSPGQAWRSHAELKPKLGLNAAPGLRATWTRAPRASRSIGATPWHTEARIAATVQLLDTHA